MTTDQALAELSKHPDVAEAYVLVREMRLYLQVGYGGFHPRIGIKIYQSPNKGIPFHFEVSHHVYTPDQAEAYFPTAIYAQSEQEAITQAISTTTHFLKSAILNGHEPSEQWLIPNPTF